MSAAGTKTLLIAGISSTLGRAVAESVAGQEGLRVVGGYRRWRPELERTVELFRVGPAELTLREVDVTNPASCAAFVETASSFPDEDLVVLYCCGKWSSGPVAALTAEEVARVVGVGLTAPINLTARLLAARRGAGGRTRIIIVTGLGGEKTGVRYNALYSAATSGLYSFIRGVGMEVAGSGNSCFGVALGLFDKGQPYIRDLCKRLVTREPTPLSEILDFLLPQLGCEGTALNGSIVELAGGMFNYQEVSRLLEEEFAQ